MPSTLVVGNCVLVGVTVFLVIAVLESKLVDQFWVASVAPLVVDGTGERPTLAQPHSLIGLYLDTGLEGTQSTEHVATAAVSLVGDTIVPVSVVVLAPIMTTGESIR